MATNEIYKYGQWISLPLPLRGTDPKVNEDPTRNGDPVLIGDIVGFAQEVGGVPISYTTGSLTVTQATNPANHLEPGWASVALTGAFCYPVEGWDPAAMGSGTAVGIVAATPDQRATLVANSEGDHWFGTIIGQTKIPMTDEDGNPVGPDVMVPIVNVVQSIAPAPNAVPDRAPAGS
ncbi:hypothetical protein [Rhodococcus qingshengii]|uniref:hypothetical protein n=1 Tax=Rhodococcus qingshengii TaxID=334542 RepID=UPI0035D8C448